MREYQNLTRAEIAALRAKTWDESESLEALSEKLKVESDAIGGSSLEEKIEQLRLMGLRRAALEEQGRLLGLLPKMEFEIRIRDSPELTAQFGPGVD